MKSGPETELADRYQDRAAKAGKALGFRSMDVVVLDESRAADSAQRKAEEAAAILKAAHAPLSIQSQVDVNAGHRISVWADAVPTALTWLGSTVTGFRPGYMGSPMPRPRHDSAWLLIRSGGLSFYLFPHFNWDAKKQYRIDHGGGDFALLSIEPMMPLS